MKINMVSLSDEELNFITHSLGIILEKANEQPSEEVKEVNDTLYGIQNLYNRLIDDYLQIPEWYNSKIRYFNKNN